MAKERQAKRQGTPYSLFAIPPPSFSLAHSECQGLESSWGEEEEEDEEERVNPPLSHPRGPHSGKLQSSAEIFQQPRRYRSTVPSLPPDL